MAGETILIVEDEAIVAADLREKLLRLGYRPLGPASTGAAALRLAEAKRPDLVLMDIRLKSGMDGVETADILRREHGLSVVFVTSYADAETISRAKMAEPLGYVQKPFNDGQISSTVEMALYKRLMERRLRESEELFSATLMSIGEAVISSNTAGEVAFMNAMAERLTGWTSQEACGHPLTDILRLAPDPVRPLPESFFEEAVARGESLRLDRILVVRRSDGLETLADLSAAPIKNRQGRVVGLVVVCRDASREEELRRQLVHSQKMEAIGVLAGGVAHDFNNILAAAIGFAEMARIKADDPDFVRGNMDMVLKACGRARDLVKHMLAFSRRSEMRTKPFRLGPSIKEELKMLRATLPSTIRIEQHITARRDVLHGNPVEMHQVLMNLCANAAHAMRESGGVLEVVLEECERSAIGDEWGELPTGPYLRLSVSDTGHGIPPDDLGRVFDPFFTTKKPGEGSGMGLSVVHGIIRAHGGAIRVESVVGLGARFTLLLPRAPHDSPSKPVPQEDAPRGQGRILFVDDEEDIAAMAGQMLTELGYVPTVKTCPAEALTLVARDPAVFDLILSDQTMPFMTGLGLAREIRRVAPDLPVVLCTGFSENLTKEAAEAAGARDILLKPLFMLDLAKAIERNMRRG